MKKKSRERFVPLQSEVDDMLLKRAMGFSLRKIADEYNVSHSTIQYLTIKGARARGVELPGLSAPNACGKRMKVFTYAFLFETPVVGEALLDPEVLARFKIRYEELMMQSKLEIQNELTA